MSRLVNAPDGFVRMENNLSLYNILGYSSDKSIKVTPYTLDVYRRLRQYKSNSGEHKGKAWVTLERLAADLATYRPTVTKHVKILEKVGLINIKTTKRGSNIKFVFTFNEPLSEEAFRSKYPEEIKKYEERLNALKDDTDVNDDDALN
jgi:DNA-binding MarR family transcriptional regulator